MNSSVAFHLPLLIRFKQLHHSLPLCPDTTYRRSSRYGHGFNFLTKRPLPCRNPAAVTITPLKADFAEVKHREAGAIGIPGAEWLMPPVQGDRPPASKGLLHGSYAQQGFKRTIFPMSAPPQLLHTHLQQADVAVATATAPQSVVKEIGTTGKITLLQVGNMLLKESHCM